MTPWARFKQQLSGIGKGRDWRKVWDARLLALEAILSKSAETVYHSPTPLYLGGDADVVAFPIYVQGGAAYVTADLTGGLSDQLPNDSVRTTS